MEVVIFFNSTAIINRTLAEASELVIILAHLTWWYAVVMAVVGIVLNVYGALYLILRAFRSSSFSCLICIVFADCFCLTVMFACLITAQLFPTVSGTALCKTMTFVTNASSLISNWCWVILWGRRYVVVFHPWIHYRYKYCKVSLFMPALLVFCLLLEGWTLVFATEVDSSCDLDESISSYNSLKYVFLAESMLQFFVPFLLITAADISVFLRIYYKRKLTIEQIESSELQSNNNTRNTNVETIMIVSEEYKKNTRASKQRMLMRFVVLASVDLLFNMPHVILSLLEAFQRGTDSHLLSYPVNYIATTVSFSFFYLQYVFNVVHIHLLVRDYSRRRGLTQKRLLSHFAMKPMSKRRHDVE